MIIPDRPLHNETQRHLRRCTGSNDAWISDLDLLIRGLIDKGLWDKLKILCVVTPVEGDSLLDLKGHQDSVKIGSPAFVADRGFTTVSTTAVIDTQYSVENSMQSNVSLACYVRQNHVGPALSLMGIQFLNSISAFMDIHLRDGGPGFVDVRMGATLTTTHSGAVKGFRAGSFDGATQLAGYRQQVASSARTSAGTYGVRPTMMVGCKKQYISSLIEAAPNQYAMWSVGFALTVTEMLDFSNLIKDYMTARGAVV